MCGLRTFPDKRTIYTIGSSNREIEEFIDILNVYGIKILIDVRRFTTSKFEWFKKEIFPELLAKHKIGYIFLGAELGGYRKGGYEAYTLTERYQKGLEKSSLMLYMIQLRLCVLKGFPGNATESLLV